MVKKLKQMGEEANRMTSPCQDVNVWAGMLTALAAGLRVQCHGNQELMDQAMAVFVLALKDGLNGQSKRALELALKLQESLVKAQEKIEGQGGLHG